MLSSREVKEVVRRRRQRTLQRRGFEQTLEHAAGAAVLQALVRGERVLGAVAAVAELAHVQRVRLLVLILEVSLEGVVAREGAAAVGTLLRLVDAPRRGRRHAEHATCKHPHKHTPVSKAAGLGQTTVSMLYYLWSNQCREVYSSSRYFNRTFQAKVIHNVYIIENDIKQ